MRDVLVSEHHCYLDQVQAMQPLPESVMTNMAQKRAFVGELYPGPNWKKKVNKMTDAQIFSIYMRNQDSFSGPKEVEPKDKEDGDDGIPF